MVRNYKPSGGPPQPPPPSVRGPKPETVELGRRCLALLADGVDRGLLAERLHVTRKKVDHALRQVRHLDAALAGKPALESPRKHRAVARRALAPAAGWAWQQDAACKGQDLALFFPPEGRGESAEDKAAREQQAKAFCRVCPVVTECLEYSIGGAVPSEQWNKSGTWGGLTDDERALERRRRMKTASNQRLREARVA